VPDVGGGSKRDRTATAPIGGEVVVAVVDAACGPGSGTGVEASVDVAVAASAGVVGSATREPPESEHPAATRISVRKPTRQRTTAVLPRSEITSIQGNRARERSRATRTKRR